MSKRKCRHRGVDRDGLTTICGLCEVVRSLGIGMRWWSSADIVATLESDRG